MHRFLAPEAFQHNVPVQLAEMTQLVNDLLDDPLVWLTLLFLRDAV